MPQDFSSPPPRIVIRSSIDFLLRAVRSVSKHFDGDMLEGLVILALLQRDCTQLPISPSESAEKESGGSARPVSVKSLARSLKTPPETMRRCVSRLIAKGWCTRHARHGIATSHSGAAQAMIAALMTDIRSDFWRMIGDLKSIDFDFDVMDRAGGGAFAEESASPSAPVSAADTEAYSNSIDRAILNFGLRVVDSGTTPFGNDYVLTCVFAAIMSANASSFAYDLEESWRYRDFTTPPPDDVRRSATLSEVSQLLGIPYETARRYVNKLIARGICARDVRKGLMIPIEILQSGAAFATGAEIVGRFVQMVGDLKHVGVDFAAIPSDGRGGEEPGLKS